MVIKRFEVYLVRFDPTVGAEIRKTRPGVVLSPIEINESLRTVIIAPLTSKTHDFPTQVDCQFGGKRGQVALDQIRAVDRNRLIKKLGKLDEGTAKEALAILREIFEE